MPRRKTTSKKTRRGGNRIMSWARSGMQAAKKHRLISKAGSYLYDKYGRKIMNDRVSNPIARKVVEAGVKAGLARLKQNGYGTRRSGMGTRSGHGTRRSGMGRSGRGTRRSGMGESLAVSNTRMTY